MEAPARFVDPILGEGYAVIPYQHGLDGCPDGAAGNSRLEALHGHGYDQGLLNSSSSPLAMLDRCSGTVAGRNDAQVLTREARWLHCRKNPSP